MFSSRKSPTKTSQRSSAQTNLSDKLQIDRLTGRVQELEEQIELLQQSEAALQKENSALQVKAQEASAKADRILIELGQHKQSLQTLLTSKEKAMPWLAGLMADYMKYDLNILPYISEIRKEQGKVKKDQYIIPKTKIEQQYEEAKLAEYKLAYVRALFPDLDEYIEFHEQEKNAVQTSSESEDPAQSYLSKEEWRSLPESRRNQLALDRYIASGKKSDWQIGRDYELSVAFQYMKNGYTVDTSGSYERLSDMGRDLIAKKDGEHLIIQCKYWSQLKTIHEKHIFQLFGTTVSYRIEQNLEPKQVKGIFITNIHLSDMARKCATLLGIKVIEGYRFVEFPRIKCNVGVDEFGSRVKIYHLPMDQQYDKVKISKAGECYAYTVEEAERLGFRRAHRWLGR